MFQNVAIIIYNIYKINLYKNKTISRTNFLTSSAFFISIEYFFPQLSRKRDIYWWINFLLLKTEKEKFTFASSLLKLKMKLETFLLQDGGKKIHQSFLIQIQSKLRDEIDQVQIIHWTSFFRFPFKKCIRGRKRRDWQLLIRSHEIFDWIFDEFPSLGRKGILFLTYKITLEIKRKIRFHLTYNWVGELSSTP